MKLSRSIPAVLAIGMFTMSSFVAFAHGADRGTAKATVGGTNVTVDYGRPLLKGRDMLKQLPAGTPWRLGADAATTIESDKDLDFGGTRLTKGKHILLAQHDASGKWSLIVSSKPANQYDSSAKLAEVPIDFQDGKDQTEMLTLSLTGQGDKGVLEIAWGTMRLSASFSAAH